jgi:hypothetical protein
VPLAALLLTHGASALAADLDGRTPAAWARVRHHRGVIALLSGSSPGPGAGGAAAGGGSSDGHPEVAAVPVPVPQPPRHDWLRAHDARRLRVPGVPWQPPARPDGKGKGKGKGKGRGKRKPAPAAGDAGPAGAQAGGQAPPPPEAGK